MMICFKKCKSVEIKQKPIINVHVSYWWGEILVAGIMPEINIDYNELYCDIQK